MVVDDSAVIRGLMTRMLEEDPDIRVTASVGNGELAIKSLSRDIVDVIILDIEMPVMDGLTALPKLLEIDRDIKIIMASTLTMRNAEISIRALSAGATEYIPKPSSSRDIGGSSDFKRELVSKIKSLGDLRRQRVGRAPAKPSAPGHAPASPGARPGATPVAPATPARPRPAAGGWHKATQDEVVLRKAGTSKPDILAVGSSTGGPQALFEFFKNLDKTLKLPIVITQHMPATFTTILAEHITRMSGWPCSEAKNGDVLTPGHILLAPGDYHMTVVNKGPQRVIAINQDPPENFCRPAVDPMLRSLVQVYGPRILTVILTGMGNDGEKGSTIVVEKGGTVIAQDEKTSVVWGMPGAVASAGLCSAVLPVKELAQYVGRFVSRTSG
ncbi:protein-glutamate methylesterase/protein-glutamine glutaminase [Varunaivibrio sulfuroxidans]|uniref:Protein-glutamate methylesterase/protein-glutamine glutaminase n=1 Tax=Varunaivibrio sulfuroxidans TaxID=1773489 RepID=A0A4R3JCT1_9PROT|nr:chemotaxis response regulator protein-glutamate methylesterase [Varunaivibrio sulfuroxidans]TCS63477.1 two-component system chemotaxis response regulator CheB [Varunaivibrio sulfuroxidans]WES32230.1 chemotaxis response regulator protein-glutamate methylesterase [Varunaivibrio sulfuroxidans]